MGANPIANGGVSLRDLRLPDFGDYAIEVPQPGKVMNEDARTLGKFLRDVIKLNAERRNFLIFGPGETVSNRLTAVFEATDNQWEAEVNAKQAVRDKLIERKQYISKYGQDMPEVRDWKWTVTMGA